MLRELDTVTLTERIPLDQIWDVPAYSPLLERDNPGDGLRPGDVGTIVHKYGGGETYEVEFLMWNGDTVAMATVPLSHLRLATDADLDNDRFVKAKRLSATST